VLTTLDLLEAQEESGAGIVEAARKLFDLPSDPAGAPAPANDAPLPAGVPETDEGDAR